MLHFERGAHLWWRYSQLQLLSTTLREDDVTATSMMGTQGSPCGELSEKSFTFGEIFNGPFPVLLGNLCLFEETFYTFVSGLFYPSLKLVGLTTTGSPQTLHGVWVWDRKGSYFFLSSSWQFEWNLTCWALIYGFRVAPFFSSPWSFLATDLSSDRTILHTEE